MDENITGRLLAAFDATGLASGNFRIVCAAVDCLSFCFSGPKSTASLSSPHSLPSQSPFNRLGGYVCHRAAEKWIKVFNPADLTADKSVLRNLFYSLTEEAYSCFRWNVNIPCDLSFSIALQGLPM
jgi:ATP adenylyltransferase/5',5'''-P-1,P-4-tetraphosphate phosphorylase II